MNCRYCEKQLATQADYDAIPENEGEHLCWSDFGQPCIGAEKALDIARDRIAELVSILANFETHASATAIQEVDQIKKIAFAKADASTLKRMVRFLRSRNGWNTVLTLVYLAAVAGGYAWARSGEDSLERFCRTWLVMLESMAGCGVMFALYLSPPWFRKSNARLDRQEEALMYQICPHGKQDGDPCEQCAEQVRKRSLSVRSGVTDDKILSLWRTVRPSVEQDRAMVYQSGPDDVDHPTFELRRLVELAIEYANARLHPEQPAAGCDRVGADVRPSGGAT